MASSQHGLQFVIDLIPIAHIALRIHEAPNTDPINRDLKRAAYYVQAIRRNGLQPFQIVGLHTEDRLNFVSHPKNITEDETCRMKSGNQKQR